jgi:hypothetical protein
MDKVRFGRALGYGARHAAKAVVKAVDAASTPSPVSSSAARPAPTAAVHAAQTAAADRVAQARQTVAASAKQAKVVGTQAKVLGKSVWSPLAKFSSTLWLQVTGTIYTLVALSLGQAAWAHRAAAHLPPSAHEAQRFYLLLMPFALFAYFAISSFVRAARR